MSGAVPVRGMPMRGILVRTELTTRLHVDLQRVASAVCPSGRG